MSSTCLKKLGCSREESTTDTVDIMSFFLLHALFFFMIHLQLDFHSFSSAA